MRRRRWHTGVEPSRLPLVDLLAESLTGVSRRWGRSVLTMLGTVLGVGSFVAVLGLTTTATAQIGQSFNSLTATTVTVVDTAAGADQERARPPMSFPDDAEERIERLNGVVAAGVWWRVPLEPKSLVISARPGVGVGTNGDVGTGISVFAAAPETLAAMEARVSSGVLYNRFHETRGELVCVLGESVARRLGITRLDAQPAVFVNGRALTVVGIVSGSSRLEELTLGLLIPRSTALDLYGGPSAEDPAQMLVQTELGAAKLIAGQAPTALSPQDPAKLTAAPPPDPRALRNSVTGDLTGLFLSLAGICLVVGAVGIANTTLVSVLEQTNEIGLRRSLGALRRHIAAQVITEATTLGLLGGLIGTALGVCVVVMTALIRDWTAVLEPLTVLPSPLVGALTGLAAGLYPAWRAATLEPAEALRR